MANYVKMRQEQYIDELQNKADEKLHIRKMTGLVSIGIISAIAVIGMFFGKESLINLLVTIFLIGLIVLLTAMNSR